MIALWMFPLAIACGNTYVLKPTEKAPSASMLLVKYLHDLGLPNGVVNVVNGGKETVNELLTHVDIKAISFVGSNSVGEHVHEVGSKNGKRVQANLGAKNHATVMMNDADRSMTVRALVGAAFGAAGQRCMALSVVILVGTESMAKVWMDELVEQARRLKVGNGFVEGVDVGERGVYTQISFIDIFVSSYTHTHSCSTFDGITFLYVRHDVHTHTHTFRSVD